MQCGGNYNRIVQNVHGQNLCAWENREPVYLPQPVSWPSNAAEPYDGVTEMYVLPDHRIDSTIGNPCLHCGGGSGGDSGSSSCVFQQARF
ncbi:hypothetical protein FKM82_027755 [Ascaphus truei]